MSEFIIMKIIGTIFIIIALLFTIGCIISYFEHGFNPTTFWYNVLVIAYCALVAYACYTLD